MASPSEKGCFRRLTDKLTCRQVLHVMVFFGFMVNYMFRVNLTIAIVDMVVPLNKSVDDHDMKPVTSECVSFSGPTNSTTVTKSLVVEDKVDTMRFSWDEKQQNMIMGSFFIGYVLTELPGGRLAEILGARRVFGYSMLASALITFVTPVAARTSYIAVIIMRAVLGFMLGATWPAMHPMAAHWIPPMERSKFISNMMASSLGAAVTLPFCGYLIATLGWESVFYVTGAIGLIWSITWFFVVYDTPASHPRITPEERQYIEEAIGSGTTKSKTALAVPWKNIFTSPPVWAIIITHGASVFGYFTVVNQLPTYMKYILAFNIKENGLLSSLPYLGKYIMAISTSVLADHLRSTGKLSTTATRKLFTTFAVMMPGLLMVAQVFLGCDRFSSVAIFTIALTVNGAVTAGYLGNGLDIAPNFSGTIFGMANTLSSFGGFVSTYIVGLLTFQNQTYGQWQIVFWILACMYTIGGLSFLFFGTGELQSWNTPKAVALTKPDIELASKEKEAVPLRRDS